MNTYKICRVQHYYLHLYKAKMTQIQFTYFPNLLLIWKSNVYSSKHAIHLTLIFTWRQIKAYFLKGRSYSNRNYWELNINLNINVNSRGNCLQPTLWQKLLLNSINLEKVSFFEIVSKECVSFCQIQLLFIII